MTAEQLRARFPNAGEAFIKLNADNNFSRLKEIEETHSGERTSRSEADLHGQICNLLVSRGIKWFGHGSTAHRSKYTIGWPDFVIPLPNGRVLFWEVKTTKGPVTQEQDACLKSLIASGHHAYVVRGYSQALDLLNEELPT